MGSGGTELMSGLRLAYGLPAVSKTTSRTVVVVTDGFVDVESEAFRFVRERLDAANVFAFGIWSGVNRALIEGLARAGFGEPFVVLDRTHAAREAERFRAYIERPLLTHIGVTFEGFTATEVAPPKLPDLMAARPLILFGKYRGLPSGGIVVTGDTGHGPFRSEVRLEAADARREAAPLKWLWARKQAEWLDDQLTLGPSSESEERLTNLGLRYSLLTSRTSFVAIDQVVANPGGALDSVNQPQPLPKGVSNLAVGDTSVELSRSEMPPGDPLLTVSAPRDARLVTAHFPFGLVKDLSYDPTTERWQTRFLVPNDVADGEYDVPVVVQRRDGRTDIVKAHYTIDSRAPDFEASAQPGPGGVLQLEVVSRDALRKVTLALAADPSVRIDLADAGDGRTFRGELVLPPGTHRLRVVVADRARNEADDLLTVTTLEAPPPEEP